MKILSFGYKPFCIATKFLQFGDNYKIYPIDIEPHENGLCIPILHEEQYDEISFKGLKSWKKKIGHGEILCIIEGGTLISCAVLNILKNFEQDKITIIYLKPKLEYLQNNALLREKIVRSILQEYARSGVFERFYLIYAPIVESLIGNIALSEIESFQSNLIADTFHRVNVFRHARPIFGDEVEENVINRIATFGYINMENGEHIPFYNIPNVLQNFCYYSIPKDLLCNDASLKEKLRKISKNGFMKVYENNYNEQFGFLLQSTSATQI